MLFGASLMSDRKGLAFFLNERIMNKKTFLSDVKAVIKIHVAFLLMPIIVVVSSSIALGAWLQKCGETVLHLKCLDWAFRELEE